MMQTCSQKGFEPQGILKLIVKHLELSPQCVLKPRPGILTSFETRQKVCFFWHDHSQESTITTNLVSIHVDEKPRIQDGLEFMSSVTIVTKRNKRFFHAIWKTTTKTYRELIKIFCIQNPTVDIPWGTFTALKPFYVHHATIKDLVMCCCKIHLHIRWAVQALIKCLQKQYITFPASDYFSLFELIYKDCPHEEHTYIPWTCTPNNTELCQHVKSKWEDVIASTADEKVTIQFTEFKKVEAYGTDGELLKDKHGNPLKRLTPVKAQVNVQFLLNFIDQLLPEIVNHRNMLKLHRSVNAEFKGLFSSAVMDVDFSENLTLGIKWEPQSLHSLGETSSDSPFWHHEMQRKQDLPSLH